MAVTRSAFGNSYKQIKAGAQKFGSLVGLQYKTSEELREGLAAFLNIELIDVSPEDTSLATETVAGWVTQSNSGDNYSDAVPSVAAWFAFERSVGSATGRAPAFGAVLASNLKGPAAASKAAEHLGFTPENLGLLSKEERAENLGFSPGRRGRGFGRSASGWAGAATTDAPRTFSAEDVLQILLRRSVDPTRAVEVYQALKDAE